jgi:hypothetical protein
MPKLKVSKKDVPRNAKSNQFALSNCYNCYCCFELQIETLSYVGHSCLYANNIESMLSRDVPGTEPGWYHAEPRNENFLCKL